MKPASRSRNACTRFNTFSKLADKLWLDTVFPLARHTLHFWAAGWQSASRGFPSTRRTKWKFPWHRASRSLLKGPSYPPASWAPAFPLISILQGLSNILAETTQSLTCLKQSGTMPRVSHSFAPWHPAGLDRGQDTESAKQGGRSEELI